MGVIKRIIVRDAVLNVAGRAASKILSLTYHDSEIDEHKLEQDEKKKNEFFKTEGSGKRLMIERNRYGNYQINSKQEDAKYLIINKEKEAKSKFYICDKDEYLLATVNFRHPVKYSDISIEFTDGFHCKLLPIQQTKNDYFLDTNNFVIHQTKRNNFELKDGDKTIMSLEIRPQTATGSNVYFLVIQDESYELICMAVTLIISII